MNPYTLLIQQLSLSAESQGSGNRYSYLYCLLKLGEAHHTAAGNPAWQSTSRNASDEVLYRLRALGLGNTFAYAETEQVVNTLRESPR